MRIGEVSIPAVNQGKRGACVGSLSPELPWARRKPDNALTICQSSRSLEIGAVVAGRVFCTRPSVLT